MDIQYVGEHLLPGKLGQFFIILAFGMSLLSTIAYYFQTSNDKNDLSWRQIARWSFRIHTVALIGIIAALFFIIYNHYFEYNYAYSHSSRSLPTHYMISCFWEGQEGSFLLWAFWQLVFGNVLIRFAKDWEDSVMTIVGLSQVFILSMLLGVEVFGYRIGSSPFILLRDAMQGAPIFQDPQYLVKYIQDGRGLNPLLQNYWMVIHPPTLFFGFASMVVPFAYAMAGLWTKRLKEWVKPALPYALVAVMVLGTGIIMGAFWAYEALNFGGFWAWDPVENASLIPWLTMISAIHVLVVYKNTGHSYFTALFLVLISFILVLYASFLTRSGILGETSVHAFTDLGMSGQLVIYVLVFLALSTWLIVKNWKQLPITEKDEHIYSREFWMFIGALVMTLSCLQVIATTSIPVYNKLFNGNVAPPVDPVGFYNQWQMPFAVIVALISAFAQYLKYKKTDSVKFWINTGVSLLMSALVTAVVVYYTLLGGLKLVFGENYHNDNPFNWMFVILIYACVFSVITNAKILGEAIKGKFKLTGSAVAHMGFALMLIGATIAASQKRVISINTSGFDYGKEFDSKNKRENVLLWKGESMKMDKYLVTYTGDTTEGVNTYYRVNYKVVDESNKVVENFDLNPLGQINPTMGLVASPDTRHYLTHDIYTHVSSVPKREEDAAAEGHDGHAEDEGYNPPSTYKVSVGDTINFDEGKVVVRGINKDVHLKDMTINQGDIAVGLTLAVIGNSDRKETIVEPVYLIKNRSQFTLSKKMEEFGLKFKFTKIIPDENKFELVMLKKPGKQKDYVIMKAIVFPYINFLWGGTIIMVIGFAFSISRRLKELKDAKSKDQTEKMKDVVL
ncbi:heme lyase CcmF/NrfE family subunit [Solitalea koreensis]|uniref:Cytochrome c-type biogenesis protein CcmF n=1 Tax=Solitalea koreensis TaxID=543615 RepID=A0A521D2G0_9SPHI|nr:cytochrome c biogenesis protein CcsA [Solitalea koreensis]SMO65875.1 cytochrome c-type biogenesis protein CcmF [Solitalea koreensis]